MLVLTRKTEQQIQIGPNITITVLEIKGHSVRLGIEAPAEVCVLRSEIASREGIKSDLVVRQAALDSLRRLESSAAEPAAARARGLQNSRELSPCRVSRVEEVNRGVSSRRASSAPLAQKMARRSLATGATNISLNAERTGVSVAGRAAAG